MKFERSIDMVNPGRSSRRPVTEKVTEVRLRCGRAQRTPKQHRAQPFSAITTLWLETGRPQL